jgi:hypothetical protein
MSVTILKTFIKILHTKHRIDSIGVAMDYVLDGQGSIYVSLAWCSLVKRRDNFNAPPPSETYLTSLKQTIHKSALNVCRWLSFGDFAFSRSQTTWLQVFNPEDGS